MHNAIVTNTSSFIDSRPYEHNYDLSCKKRYYELRQCYQANLNCNVQDINKLTPNIQCCVFGVLKVDYNNYPDVLFNSQTECIEHVNNITPIDGKVVAIEDDTGQVDVIKCCQTLNDIFCDGLILCVKGHTNHDIKLIIDSIILLPTIRPTPINDKTRKIVCIASLDNFLTDDNTQNAIKLFDNVSQLNGNGYLIITGGIASQPYNEDDTLNLLAKADKLISLLSSMINVILIPGYHDYTVTSLPRMPLHSSLLPISSCLNTFKCLTSPCKLTLFDFVKIHILSQESFDFYKAQHINTDSINLMNSLVTLRQINPTGTSRVFVYPADNIKHLIIEQNDVPHLIIAPSKLQNEHVVSSNTQNGVLTAVLSQKNNSTHILEVNELFQGNIIQL